MSRGAGWITTRTRGRTRTVSLDGAFLRAPVGSTWWFLAERLTLTGIAVWSLPRARRPRGWAARDAIAAAASADPELDEPPVIVDPSGVRWECDVRPLHRLDRSEGALPVDPAPVAMVVELHPESPDDDGLDGLWLPGIVLLRVL